jgi:hypothetical protein
MEKIMTDWVPCNERFSEENADCWKMIVWRLSTGKDTFEVIYGPFKLIRS